MSYSGGWRPHIEDALCLNLPGLFADGSLRANTWQQGTLRWTNTRTRAQVAAVGFNANLGADSGTLTLDYTATYQGQRKTITCTIRLVTLPRHYGGRIWYAVCPYTGKRARKLYKWGPIDWFCHREAITPKPTYEIQRVNGSAKFMEQRWGLRRKLGDDFSTLFDRPFKPKWMRQRTFERYAARDAELAQRELAYDVRMLGRMGITI